MPLLEQPYTKLQERATFKFLLYLNQLNYVLSRKVFRWAHSNSIITFFMVNSFRLHRNLNSYRAGPISHLNRLLGAGDIYLGSYYRQRHNFFSVGFLGISREYYFL